MSCKIFIRLLIVFLFFQKFAIAQRNIIDVPTSDLVEYKQLFSQVQFSIADRKIKSSIVGTWGLGKNWEAGFVINKLTFNMRPSSHLIETDPQNTEDDVNLMVNLQKGFTITKFYNIGIGTRTGFALAKTIHQMRFSTYNYFNHKLSIPDTDNQIIFGIYYGNPTYVAEGKNWGYQLGLEKEVIRDKMDLFLEYISGSNAISVINLGMQLNLPKNWSFDIGAQLPGLHSGNPYGIVIQFAKN